MEHGSVTSDTYKWPRETAILKLAVRPQPPPSPYLMARKYPPGCQKQCNFHGIDVLVYQKLKNKELYYKAKPRLQKWESIYQRDYNFLPESRISPDIFTDINMRDRWALKNHRDEFAFDITPHPLPRFGRPYPVTFVAGKCMEEFWPGPSEYQDTISKDGLFEVTTMQQHRFPQVTVRYSVPCKCP